MATRTLHFLFVSGIALGPVACGLLNEWPVRITDSDAGSTVNLRRGQTLEITLPGNPSTGYMWEVVPGADSILQQEGEANFEASSRLVGAGGVITFTFVAINPGEAPLKFIYYRSFEPDVLPADTFSVTVIVAP